MEYNDSFFEKKYYAPTDVISGYQVRPGYYLRNGASVVEGGINFTVHSYGATSCNSKNGGRTVCSDSIPRVISYR